MGVLVDRYAGVVLDLDGVLFRGDVPIPSAGPTVTALRDRGIGVVFATNNATRTPDNLVDHLARMGIDAHPDEVVTSSLAAAAMLEPGTRCLVVGMKGLQAALAERGCVEVDDPEQADAVVAGLDRDLTYDKLTRATWALTHGARFVGTNADATFPVPGGVQPGAGSILAALVAASGREPEIAGKPQAPLFEASAAKLPDGALLMVGDRVETDIVGAQLLGWDTALVLSGVTSADEAGKVDPAPTWVLDDVGGLLDVV